MTLLVPCLTLVLAAARPPVSLAGDFGEPRVIVAAPADPAIAHLAWPKVVRLRDGALVVGYVAGRFHGTHGGGCPAVSVSTDGGKTFSPPHVLKHYGLDDAYTSGGNVALGVAEDGAAILLSMAYKGDEANTIDGWRSADGGKTWREVNVSRLAAGKTGSVYGHVFPIPGKGLAVVGHFRKGSTTRTAGLWMGHSADSGKTWGDAQVITEVPLVEPAFVFARGRLVGLARPLRTPAWYTQLTSDDLGKTWAVEPKGLASDNPKGMHFPSPGLFADPGDPDRLLALVSQRFRVEAGNGLYGRIDLYAADVQKLAWARVGTVARFPRTLAERSDLTYGWMTPVGGRRWFAVFYCGKARGASDLYGLEFEVPPKE
jgi:hypothetical protein